MDGDDLPDLVVTDLCEDDQGVGETHWRVYKSDGSGFSSTATNFSIPSGGYRLPGEGAPCNFARNTDFAYALTDMDGDDLPDLVVTDLCDDDQGVGATHWRVYESDGDGFSNAATNFSIPSGGFRLPGEGAPCNFARNTDFAYALTDMDGDDLPDLVVTDLCDDDQGVGATLWRVYKSDGDGFSDTATNFSIPSGGFRLPGEGAPCNFARNTDFAYALTDMDGDDLPDLVVTDLCEDDQGVGSSHWRVYDNEGDGFAATALDLPLPSGGLSPPQRGHQLRLRAGHGLCLHARRHGRQRSS